MYIDIHTYICSGHTHTRARARACAHAHAHAHIYNAACMRIARRTCAGCAQCTAHKPSFGRRGQPRSGSGAAAVSRGARVL